MEVTGSSGRHRAVAAGSGGGRGKRRSVDVGTGGSIRSLGTDLLCIVFALLDHFDLVRCSVVCKSWNNLIYTSSLMKDLYNKRNPHLKCASIKSDMLETSMKIYLEEIAMEEHKLSFLRGSVKVDQWSGHHARVNVCRMKRGLILTGVGDKVLRLWSAESCNYLDEYVSPEMNQLVDYDFDENKIVGLTSDRICIWRRHGQRGIFQSCKGIFTRGLCMRYIDPEAVIGCEDGRVRVFDMYSGRCSRIIRMHSGPVTCLTLTDDQLVIGGSTFGNIAIADLSSGKRMGSVKSCFSPTGLKCFSFNMHSYSVFAGSTSGYAHCWDLRTLRPVWETRVSPNVIYTVHHLSNDTSMLAVGGIDGVLRILNQSTGEILSSLVIDATKGVPLSSKNSHEVVQKKVRRLQDTTCLDIIPRYLRPPITCLAVGMNKIVTTHNEKFIRAWRFHMNN
ncbi:F-box/WD-40 repeat-containing protein At3g52030-like isoform X2 [Musa acuminata AAA Group]|uniref:F-box/WD-40 repeat-containing protein At3g52030-like isoform X2 n=1 Tax=Musa acuminata AAA Group TaxID=214697 RepID=UPI0031D27943